MQSMTNPVPQRRADFTPIDEAVHLLDTPSEPWTVQLELAFAVHLELERLGKAVSVALARHPLARARKVPARLTDREWQWAIPDDPDLDCLRLVPCPGPGDLERARDQLLSRSVPLDESPPLRIWVARGPEGDTVLTSVNHAAFDGMGLVRLWRSIAAAYRGENDPETPVSLEVARDVAALTASAHPVVRARRFRMLADKASDLLRPPARVAPDGGAPAPGYGFRQFRLDETQTAALRDRRIPATVNDLLVAATHRAVDDWNSCHGVTSRRISVLVPVNLRPPHWSRDVVTNLVLQTRVSSGTRHRRSDRRLVERVRRQTLQIKAGGAGALMEVLGGSRSMPLWTKHPRLLLWATGNRLVDTAIVSNLGEMEPPIDLGPDVGEAESMWFSAPTRMPCGLSLGAVTTGGRLHISLRYRPPALDAEGADAFVQVWLAALERTVEHLGGRRPGRRPWRSQLGALLTLLEPSRPDHRHPRPPHLPQARVVDVEGRGEMFYRVVEGSDVGTRPDAPRPADIVLLHGWALSADLNFFAGVYDVASGHGRTFAPDLRGHGRGLRSTDEFTLERAADDVAGFIRRLDLENCVLVGYSMGASVALLVASRHPDLVGGLVLASSALQWKRSLRERVIWGGLGLAEWAFRLGAPEGLSQRYLRLAARRSPRLAPHTDWMRAEMRRGDPIDIGQAAHGLSGFDARSLAPSVAVPASVVVTHFDRMIRRRRQLELAAAIPGAHLVEVAGAHNAWLARPGEFNAALDEALGWVCARRR